MTLEEQLNFLWQYNCEVHFHSQINRVHLMLQEPYNSFCTGNTLEEAIKEAQKSIEEYDNDDFEKWYRWQLSQRNIS